MLDIFRKVKKYLGKAYIYTSKYEVGRTKFDMDQTLAPALPVGTEN